MRFLALAIRDALVLAFALTPLLLLAACAGSANDGLDGAHAGVRHVMEGRP